ncbi:MAG: complex I subunit 5 family protein [Candidatus Fimadaptatus sp.]
MNPIYLLVPILLPVLAGLAVGLWPALCRRRARNAVTLAVLAANCLLLIPVLTGGDMTLTLFTLSDSLPVLLHVDATGRLFAVIMCFVWAAAGAYSFEYMAHEENEARYYAFYLASLGALMALCFAGSIVTLYMFYEAMTLLTFPLVMHTMSRQAVAAGIKYLIYSVAGASLALMGIFMLSPYVSSFSFAPGGVLDAARVSGHEGTVLLAAFVMLLGFGAKAGMYPLHGWLPTAHPAAPSPASAVLSGVITKAGVLGALRTIFCFVGADTLRGTWVQTAIMALALFTVFMGSLLAYREGLLKKRLAYSTVSQVSYVLLGLISLTPLGLVGALLHVVCHSLVKDVLFMSAGAIISKTHLTRVDELDGIGKRMPVVMWCFTLASIGLVGIPPCLGFVSKWYLAQGALGMSGVAGAFNWLVPAVLLISALLTAGYLLPISIRGFLPGRDESGAARFYEKCEPTCVMLIPLVILTALSVILGMFPGGLMQALYGIAGTLM